MKWISVEYALPGFEIQVLVCDIHGDIQVGSRYQCINEGKQAELWFGLNADEITHWMPLPKLPKGIKADEQ